MFAVLGSVSIRLMRSNPGGSPASSATPLLSDPDKAVMSAWGAFGEKKNYGKVVQGVIRSTFLVAVDDAGVGTIEQAQYNVKATGHVARVMKGLN